MHGGGVAAAISRAGGPSVQRESDEKAPIALGETVETTAGHMPARYVIHAATMELGGPTSADIIERATESTLAKAEELGCRSLALVAFGTGVAGFPIDDPARIMVDVVRRHDGQSLERIVSPPHGAAAAAAPASGGGGPPPPGAARGPGGGSGCPPPAAPVLVAPTSFRGPTPAAKVAQSIAAGLRASGQEAVELPLGDGGEGTMDALVSAR